MNGRLALLALFLALPATAWGGYQQDFEKSSCPRPGPASRSRRTSASTATPRHDEAGLPHDHRRLEPELARAERHLLRALPRRRPQGCRAVHVPAAGVHRDPPGRRHTRILRQVHVGILSNFLESGHGKALRAGRTAPSCVTCHGSHGTQKAGIDIINQQLCSKCHSTSGRRS